MFHELKEREGLFWMAFESFVDYSSMTMVAGESAFLNNRERESELNGVELFNRQACKHITTAGIELALN